MAENFVLKGHICYSRGAAELEIVPDGYLVCVNGKSEGVYRELPEHFRGLPFTDWGDRLIIPGLVDLHLHAPQYSFRGLGMDLELLEWLETRAFPEEARYQSIDYAGKAYSIFAENLKKGATTRACIFATIHRKATELLMDMLEETGLKTMVGKVNMDRNAPDILCEESAELSEEDTKQWLSDIKGRYKNTEPILTPRFVPSCSDRLMEQLGKIRQREKLPVQSHLSENKGEIDWVKELCPWSVCYGDVYEHFGLLSGSCPAVMAHCVWCSEEELELLKESGAYVAHCPQSNTCLSSGIAPIREYLNRGIHVGLGTDVAGGFSDSVFRAMADAIQVSKLRWRLLDEHLKPLTVEEAFYLGTAGGGSFFGKVGSFEAGYELDAVVLDDVNLKTARSLTVRERLERLIYLFDDRNVTAKYVAGERILL